MDAIIDQISTINIENTYSAIQSKTFGLPKPKTKIIGLQINGFGNGHLTQGKVIYDVLIKHYDIPIVVVYGRNDTNGIMFKQSQIIFEPTCSTNTSVNDGDILPLFTDFISVKKTKIYEANYQINYWINLFVSDYGNFRTHQLAIANQFSTTNAKLLIPIYAMSTFAYITYVSMLRPSILTDKVMPPLISLAPFDPKRPISSTTILCYSVSGDDFPKTIEFLSRFYPKYTFHLFLNYNPSISFPTNVIIHPTSTSEFQTYMKQAAAVLCTTGHELILECVFHGIPVASMPCSEAQEEQVENFHYYTKQEWCVPLDIDTDIETLICRDVSLYQKCIKACIENRDERILKLIEECN
jgi:hypothetical protein